MYVPSNKQASTSAVLTIAVADRNEICMEYVKCNLCGSDRTKLLFTGRDRLYDIAGTFNLVRCQVCRLVYINPRPAEKDILAY